MLEDVLTGELFVVFSSTATPPDRPVRDPAYYSARGNKFWSVLFRTHLTPRQLRPEEYSLVLAHDIGLTDLVQKRMKGDAQPTPEDFDVAGFRRRIAENHPKIVAFNGKETAKRVLQVDTIRYGKQKETLEGAEVWVLPSTSMAADGFWDERHWQELAAEVKRLRKAG